MGKKPSLEKRAAILAAATDAFRDAGFEAASMDRIAERANVSKRTVYNHFSSKEALFEAVVEQLVEKAMADKRIEWNPSKSLREQLAMIARSKSAIADNPAELALMRVILGVFVSHPELVPPSCKVSESDDPLVPWLKAAKAANRLKVDDVELAAKTFWAMASGALFWPAIIEGPMPDVERSRIIEELVEMFLARHR
jgi:TetR/AcrR family transcriptional regulator of autoinduction and epiphytic fitness